MAEFDEVDRTESPTSKRLEDARKRGQVPRSRDLAAAATTLTGGVALYAMGDGIGARLLAMMRNALSFTLADATQTGRMGPMLLAGLHSAALAVGPLLGLLLAATLLTPMLMGGWAFSGEALQPKWERLNPLAGVGRLFAQRNWIEVLKALARFCVVAIVAWLLLRHQFATLMGLGGEAVGSGIRHSLHLTGVAFMVIGSSLGLIALVDVPLALWQHHKSLRMTLQEVRDEARESEGNPEVRGRVRRMQQDMSRRRMMSEVPRADVVIMNPTHYAVALRYDDARMRAPVVVAKGVDLIALQIRKVADAHGVPVVEAPPLARALYAGCELGAEVPTRLYAAVAQLLTYVYQLRAAVRVGRQPPPPPSFEQP